MNRDLNHAYIMQVKKCCPFSFKKKVIKTLKNNLLDFSEQNLNYTIDDLINHFGEPQSFVSEYIMAIDNSEKIKLINKTKWIKVIAIILFAFALIIASLSIWVVIDSSRSTGYYYSEELIDNTLSHNDTTNNITSKTGE